MTRHPRHSCQSVGNFVPQSLCVSLRPGAFRIIPNPAATMLGAAVLAVFFAPLALATDTAFWTSYAPDEHTYALFHFDDPAPLAAAGGVAKTEGKLSGGAEPSRQGKLGGALRFDGSGNAAFPTSPFDPRAIAIHEANRNFSLEAWIKPERYPAAGTTAPVVMRSENGGAALGFSLFIDAEGRLGMSVKPTDSDSITRTSQPGKIPLGVWTHVAGVFCAGHLSVGADTLFVNGIEVFTTPSNSAAAGLAADTDPAPVHIGGAPGKPGFVGLIDEVRVHGRVGKFWPQEPTPWIGRIATEGLPPVDSVLARDRQPTLMFPLDDDPRPVAAAELRASDPAIIERFKIHFDGDYIPGVKGKAARGALDISGFRLADWREGSLEVWVRPHGVNNASDRNVTVIGTSGFTTYFTNNVGPSKALAVYYTDAEGKLRLYGDALGTELHPGRWYHLVVTWDATNLSLYIDGRLAASGENNIGGTGGKGVLDRVGFNQHKPEFDVDELAIYEVRLSAAEAANRFWSHVDPGKMVAAAPPAPVSLEAWRMPSENTLHYRLKALPGITGIERATLRLTDGQGREVVAVERGLTGEFEQFATPELADGQYTLTAVARVGGKDLSSDPIVFTAKKMPWQDNRLGITDEVFPPFEPVRVNDCEVSVVLRKLRMNGFGLWDSVVAQGRELLAAPIRLCYLTDSGEEGGWNFGPGEWLEKQPHLARFRATAVAAGGEVKVTALSEIEMDGMMKVTLTLAPGERPAPIRRLWLEIPVESSEAPLMHEDTGTMRHNYSGLLPGQPGVVWQARRHQENGSWRNAFCGYVWVGGTERGLAWFAENDRGWITEKNQSDRPLQQIVRENGRVVSQVNLVDIPATLDAPREIVFGLQASPTKPMPEDWRTGTRGGGLAVNPWGGHQCADKFPFEDRWEIVDKVIESQTTGKDNREWFEEMRRKHDIPPVYGTADWVQDLQHFAGRRERPILTYFEEMAVSTYRDEWHVFKDEWCPNLLDSRRSWPKGYGNFQSGGRGALNYRANFSASYRDYAAWYANEWLRRGVGLYWDNTFLTTSDNPLTSAAYLCEDGEIQPALGIWNQREYSKRAWNLTKQWERKRGEKMLFLQHMTNASLLPLLSWCTTAFDNEFSADVYSRNVGFPKRHPEHEPFPPDYLRAQSLGRQTGNYPALCHAQFTPSHYGIDPARIPLLERDLPDNPGASIWAQKRDWGMSRVHEIPGGGFGSLRLEHALRGFGYGHLPSGKDGPPPVNVHNYWAERPALKTDRDDLKWLLVARPQDKRIFLILQSWSREPGRAKLTIDFDVIGFRPEGVIENLETGAILGDAKTGGCEVELNWAYDVRVIGAGAPPRPANVLFMDDFTDGASPRWSYVSSFFEPRRTGAGGLLRLAENQTPWQGPSRLEMWDGVDDWHDATVEVAFAAAAAGSERTPLFTLVTRAGRPAWSQHGLTHTALANGQFITVVANPAQNNFEIERWTIDADGKRTPTLKSPLGPLDGGVHALSLTMQGPQTTVRFDGAAAATFDATPRLGGAFGLRADPALSDTRHVDLHRIAIRRVGNP